MQTHFGRALPEERKEGSLLGQLQRRMREGAGAATATVRGHQRDDGVRQRPSCPSVFVEDEHEVRRPCVGALQLPLGVNVRRARGAALLYQRYLVMGMRPPQAAEVRVLLLESQPLLEARGSRLAREGCAHMLHNKNVRHGERNLAALTRAVKQRHCLHASSVRGPKSRPQHFDYLLGHAHARVTLLAHAPVGAQMELQRFGRFSFF